MKRRRFTALILILTLCIALTGCKVSEKEKLANAESFLMRVLDTPHEDLIEIAESLPITFNEAGTVGAVTPEDSKPLTDAIYELLGDEMEETARVKYSKNGGFGLLDPADGFTPKSVTFQGSENNYRFIMDVTYDDNGEAKDGTVSGRIQFDDKGKINFFSVDKWSWR